MPGISWVQIGIGAAAAFALSWLIGTVIIDGKEKEQKTALAKQAQDLNAACDKDKAITKEANDDLQKQISDIAAKRIAVNRVQLPSCIVPIPASGTNIAASGGKHAGQHGISTSWLRNYAAKCETYRQERVTLEKFITQERQ